jgi:hypothetical protein
MLVASTTLPLVTPSIYFSSTTGVINSCGSISINTVGQSRIYINSTGNIGVGTINPQNLIDVVENSNPVFEVTSLGSAVSNYINFGYSYSTPIGSSGYGFREVGGIMQYSNLSQNWSPLDGVYIENISKNTTLAPYGLSLINSLNTTLSLQLPNNNTGAVKYLSLEYNTGKNVFVSTSRGSMYIGPGIPKMQLIYTGAPYWNIQSPSASLFTTTLTNSIQVTSSTTLFSNSLALSADGNTLAIGINNFNPGNTYIYIRTGNLWTLQQTLTGIPNTANQGQSVSLSGDGNTLVVGSPNENDGQGGVYVFTRSGTTWTQQTEILTASTYSAFGYSVSISVDGNTLAIGAPSYNSNVGAVEIWFRNGTTWIYQAVFTGSNYSGSPSQGASISISANGDTVAFGGPGNSNVVGAVWVFKGYNGIWSQVGNYYTGGADLISVQLQGSSVCLSADGNTLFIGAPGDNSSVGCVYVFSYINGNYIQQGDKLIANAYVNLSSQGYSVWCSADANTLYVGAPGDNNNLGAIFSFIRIEGAYQFLNKFSGSITNGKLGTATTCSPLGDTLVSSAPGASSSETVYIYN